MILWEVEIVDLSFQWEQNTSFAHYILISILKEGLKLTNSCIQIFAHEQDIIINGRQEGLHVVSRLLGLPMAPNVPSIVANIS